MTHAAQRHASLFDALTQMFDHDRSAVRGEMATRRLIVFRHATALGSAHAHDLFKRVDTLRAHQGSTHPIGARETDNWPPARRFEDYVVTLDGKPTEELYTTVDVS